MSEKARRCEREIQRGKREKERYERKVKLKIDYKQACSERPSESRGWAEPEAPGAGAGHRSVLRALLSRGPWNGVVVQSIPLVVKEKDREEQLET